MVVEKDAVFQRLVEEGFCGATDSILVTAKGMPDLCTRAFLQVLTSFFPKLMSVAGERPQEELSLSNMASFVAMLDSFVFCNGLKPLKIR